MIYSKLIQFLLIKIVGSFEFYEGGESATQFGETTGALLREGLFRREGPLHQDQSGKVGTIPIPSMGLAIFTYMNRHKQINHSSR